MFTTAFVFLAVINQAVLEENPGAVQYNKEDFEANVAERPHFVKFYAPWCGHCKRLAPTWDELAQKFEPETCVVAKVDCTVETALCSAHSVSGYPTLKFFNGKLDESTAYRGPRDIESLLKFTNEQLGVDKDDQEENEMVPEGTQAEEDDKPKGVSKEGHVFVLEQSTYEGHVGGGHHFVKFYAPWCPHCKNMAGAWDQLAEVYNTEDPEVLISKVDCTAHRDVCTANDVKGYPSLLWITNGKKVEKYSGGRDLDSLKAFVEKMKVRSVDTGKDEEKIPKPKEQEEEKDTLDDPVLVLDSSSFTDTIKKGITFVKFYAPWCGHCKRLAPTWVELGKKYQESESIKIGKVDCTQYRDLCSSNQVRGFPTLILFQDGEKLADYNGKRDLDSLSSFLTEKVPHDEL